jgi:hypothetical protein
MSMVVSASLIITAAASTRLENAKQAELSRQSARLLDSSFFPSGRNPPLGETCR